MKRTLDGAAVAVRLRRLWVGEVQQSPLLASSDFEGTSLDVGLRRVGAALVLQTPYDFGAGDPFSGPFGAFLLARVREVSEGAVQELGWEHDPDQRPVTREKRERTGDIDVFAPGDPVLADYPAILATLRSRLTADAAPAALEAVGALRLVGASRHRLWFAAPSVARKEALRTVPGAGGVLVPAVQAVQRSQVPLYRVVVDGSYRARSALLRPA